MEYLANLYNSVADNIEIEQFLAGLTDIPTSLLVLIVGLCLFGTNIVANITSRANILEYGVTFSGLFFGALIANKYIADIDLPVTSQLAHSAITANIGMTCAGLFIMGAYGTQRA